MVAVYISFARAEIANLFKKVVPAGVSTVHVCAAMRGGGGGGCAGSYYEMVWMQDTFLKQEPGPGRVQADAYREQTSEADA
eukprot:COSAG01_NODE_3211_length_6414_cov_7.800475_9_plen_81_part_00